MKRTLLGLALWAAIALSLVGLFNFFQNVGHPSPPPQDLAPRLVALLISWSPFFFLIGVWIVIMVWMRRTPAAGDAPLSARTLDDPAHWRDCAGRARVVAGQFADPESQRHMLEIVERYEYLAQQAEERRRRSGS